MVLVGRSCQDVESLSRPDIEPFLNVEIDLITDVLVVLV